MSQVGFNVIVGLLLRGVLMAGAGWLAGKGLLPQGSIEEWVGATTLAGLALGWSYYSKFTAKQEQNVMVATALKAPMASTIADVQATVDAGLGATVANGVAAKVLLPFLLASTLALMACHPPVTIQTPEGQRAYTADQVVLRVNELQAAAIQAESTGGLPTATTRVIVRFCVVANQTLATTPAGWGVTVFKGWEAVKADPLVQPYLKSNPSVALAASAVDLVLAIFGGAA